MTGKLFLLIVCWFVFACYGQTPPTKPVLPPVFTNTLNLTVEVGGIPLDMSGNMYTDNIGKQLVHKTGSAKKKEKKITKSQHCGRCST